MTKVPFLTLAARWMAKVTSHVGPPAAAKWSFGTASVMHSKRLSGHGLVPTSSYAPLLSPVVGEGSGDSDGSGSADSDGEGSSDAVSDGSALADGSADGSGSHGGDGSPDGDGSLESVVGSATRTVRSAPPTRTVRRMRRARPTGGPATGSVAAARSSPAARRRTR